MLSELNVNKSMIFLNGLGKHRASSQCGSLYSRFTSHVFIMDNTIFSFKICYKFKGRKILNSVECIV